MKIQITRGQYDNTCTDSTNLIQNQIEFPQIRDIITYSEQRMVSTLIVSGAKEPFQTAPGSMDVPTQIGTIPKDKLVGNRGYRYRVWGRIQKSSVINQQIGTSGSDGTFKLSIKDDYLVPGMNAVFHSQLEARVMSAPSGTDGNWIYEFHTVSGATFDYSTDVAPQDGEKTVFGGYTSYGDKSERGYSRSHYPDEFINHTTTQRKSFAMSGSANNTVIWLEFNGKKGWYLEKQRQANVQFMLEDEHQKFWGTSSMRNTDGTLRSKSLLRDANGNEVVQGDGIREQIRGRNDAFSSGVNGAATYDDYRDMMTVLKRKANNASGNRWYAVTGTVGMSNAQDVLGDRATNNFNITVNKDNTAAIGGAKEPVGMNFNTLNIDGNQVVFVEHPLFDDEERWTQRGADGELLMSGNYYFLDLSDNNGQRNIEIMGRGAYGGDRTMVSGTIKGLTGAFGALNQQIQSSVDADEHHMLKEDGIFIYNTASSGILHRSST